MYYELLDNSFTLVNDMLHSIPCCLATGRRINRKYIGTILLFYTLKWHVVVSVKMYIYI